MRRSAFLASAAAMPLFAEPARALDALQRIGGDEPLPGVIKGSLSPANTRAASIARSSPFIRAQYGAMQNLILSIGNPQLRDHIALLLADPRPRYAWRYPTLESRLQLRDQLAAAGMVGGDAPVEGIFPPGTASHGLVQPFWSAPGSADDSHHGYPGGLLAHELFNARMSDAFVRNYNAEYFGGRVSVDRDLTVAAALYHDIMKTVVFQYNADGTFLPELSIGGTGGHHVLSGAEAIVRGRDARFVLVLLSAHAAPSLGDEVKVATWCRAAAMVAGVDPIEFGLLKKSASGYALAGLPPTEAFVSCLSDHDYVLSVHAAHVVRPALDALAPRAGIAPADASGLQWWRLEVLARVSEIALYHELLRGGAAFERAVLSK